MRACSPVVRALGLSLKEFDFSRGPYPNDADSVISSLELHKAQEAADMDDAFSSLPVPAYKRGGYGDHSYGAVNESDTKVNASPRKSLSVQNVQ